MRMAAKKMLWLMQTHLELGGDDAYSLASVAMDLAEPIRTTPLWWLPSLQWQLLSIWR